MTCEEFRSNLRWPEEMSSAERLTFADHLAFCKDCKKFIDDKVKEYDEAHGPYSEKEKEGHKEHEERLKTMIDKDVKDQIEAN
jgi:hypothetical protein